MEQNSAEWLEWRKQGIGGSDAPIVLGLSPWKTAYELWEEKTGLVESDQESMKFITDKGHRLEPKAKALYEVETGIALETKLVQREDRPEHRASLDGFNAEKSKVAEIKYVGAGEKWEMALKGQIPNYYMAQMHWQLYVSGAESNDYVAFNEKDFKIKIITVYPDIDFIKNMLKEVDKFWKLVVTKKEPRLSDRDYKRVSSREMKDSIDEYVKLKTEIDTMTEKLKGIKEKITDHPRWNHRRMIHGDVKLLTKTRKGSVDFKKIVTEHLPELDTSEYIKPSTTYKEIRL